MKKLLITGTSGMLGSNIAAEIGSRYEIFGTYKSYPNPNLKNQTNIDLTDTSKVKSMIDSVMPDIIIHCAALTNVETCEKNHELATATNVTATENLISALGPKKKVIYISTDSIFDGNRGNYSETDKPHPLNNYAKSKLEGEKCVEHFSDNYIIVRTNMFGWNYVKGQSFAEWIFNSLEKKNTIRMFTDVMFSPINASMLTLLIEKLFNLELAGILNIGSRDTISKYDFGIQLAELFDLDKSLIAPISVDDFEFKAKRPKNTSLNVSKAEKLLGLLPTVESGVKEFYNKRRLSI